MTAVGGFWSFSGAPEAERNCARILAAQTIYGQESAQHSDGAIALGRRIFRALPEDRFDRRPMVCRDGRILVADVRLDNRDDLARALHIDSRDLPDAALLARGLERWGDEVLERLVGEFAFACWDPAGRRLLLARDFAGQRPLHYYRGQGFFAFASMPKGLLALSEVPRRADLDALAAWLAALTERSHCFFEGIRSLAPGEALVVTREELRSRSHWTPDLSPLRLGSEADYAEAMLELLDAAIAARLRGAGKEVGSHLSGGLDSAAVATGAARLLGAVQGRLVAYTAVPRAGYDGPPPPGRIADEGPLAAATASLYANIEHVLVRDRRHGPLERLDRSFSLSDQPAMNPSNLGWIDAIKDHARNRGLKVLLIGEFGNLSLSYSGDELLSSLLARGRLPRLVQEIRGMREAGVRWRTVAGLALGPLLPPGVWRAIRRLRSAPLDGADNSNLRPGVLHRFTRSGRSPLLVARRSSDYRQAWLAAIGRYDPGNSRKGTLAGWGIDIRDPTADRRLVEYCLRVPLEVFHSKGRSRALARLALAGRVAPAALECMSRGYQAADWHEILVQAKADLVEEVERASRSPESAAILDMERLARLARDLPNQGWESVAAIRDYRGGLLRALAAADFIRRASGSNR